LLTKKGNSPRQLKGYLGGGQKESPAEKKKEVDAAADGQGIGLGKKAFSPPKAREFQKNPENELTRKKNPRMEGKMACRGKKKLFTC